MELRETLDDVFSAMIIIMKKSHVKAFRTEVDTFMHTIAIPLRSFVHLSSKVHIANVKSVLKEVLDALNQLAASWESERLSTRSANAKLLIQGWDRVTKRLRDCIGSSKPEHRGKSGWKYIRTGRFDDL